MKSKKKTLYRAVVKYVLDHRPVFTFIFILLYVLTTVCIWLFIPSENAKKNLDSLVKAAQVSSFLFIVISSIIAVWQYHISCKQVIIKNDTEKVQKSIELMEYYKDNVLDKSATIKFIFNNSNITKITEKINKCKIRDFNMTEVEDLLSKNDIEAIKKIEDGDGYFLSILMANEAYSLNLPGIQYDFIHNKDDNSTVEINKVNKKKVINAFLSNYISKTLNNLELFSMYFTHNIADESVIYQSAHQTFIEIAELLYYNIAKNNTLDCSTYYTNLIELYRIWKNRQLEQKKVITNQKRDSIVKGTTVSNLEL